MKTVHHRTCVYCIGYHIVFCTKYRRKVLQKEIDSSLKEIITVTAVDKGFEIGAIETGLDHVHVFISAAPHVPVSDLVKWIKGISARKLFMIFPGLKKQTGEHLWNPSYYVGTVGDMSADVVRRYIESQKEKV
ncbi:MAG: IS200/IS605 family transposase [Smithellaceae bacterium]|nr:IS200/IS605 family transposase [Smithellaceae bacterium]